MLAKAGIYRSRSTHSIANAVLIAACVCLSITGLKARPATAQSRQEAPPPPKPVYDPVPGPFSGIVDEHGALEDVGVAANAIRSWAGPRLSAFTLCFQPASEPIDWTRALSALSNVSRELKARGASVVVIDAMRICVSPSKPPITGKSSVEIKGVIRSYG